MKILKRILLGTILIISISIAAFILYASISTAKYHLEPHKLDQTSSLAVYDSEGKILNTSALSIDNFSELPNDLISAFTSIEDKRFFQHGGVDFKRILGAAFKNITSRSLSQGGSTISQQLIKNTHLSGDKKFSRKLAEIKLAYSLEKTYSKQQILVMYLNKIYFGNGIYGVANAANYYFEKDVSELQTQECAYLAGLVKAPTTYSSDQDKGLSRRNLVLKEMFHDGKLSESQYLKAVNSAIATVKGKSKITLSDVSSQAAKLIGVSEKELCSSGCKIYTSLNPALMTAARETLTGVDQNYDQYVIVADNRTRQIVAAASSCAIDYAAFRRLPGSVVKPLIPYAMAFEENIITPLTKINDAPCTFGDYTPKNYNDVYRGEISVRDAVKYSSNVVAVKTIEYAGMDKTKIYANKFGFELNENDYSYALALGGMSYGLTPYELLSAYMSLANGGLYGEISAIDKIVDCNGNTIFEHNKAFRRVMRDDTAFLITDILRETAKSGTAKKLKDLSYDVAAKTGTAGSSDAWTAAYTTDYTILSWCGRPKGGNLPENITGGGVPCETVKTMLTNLYRDRIPLDFYPPESVMRACIDKYEYDESGRIVYASAYSKNILEDYFSVYKLPESREEDDLSAEFTVSRDFFGNVISLDCKDYLEYDVYRTYKGRQVLLKRIDNFSGKIFIRDRFAPIGSEYTVDVFPKAVPYQTLEQKRNSGETLSERSILIQ